MTLRTYDLDRVRAKFKALRVANPPAYLDGPAGTQVPDQVVDRVVEALTQYRANVHGNFASSIRATEVIEQARHGVADLFNAPSKESIVFGANMTSITFAMTRTLGALFGPGDELVLTAMQHDGNATPWLKMAAERQMTVRRVEFDLNTYQMDGAALDSVLSERTKLVAINAASNVLGTINDVAAICAKASAVGALTYVDAVQYAPHCPVDVERFNCDFLVASIYKIFGPHLGALYVRPSVAQGLQPHKLRVSSDGVPDRFESGTKSLEAIAGTLGAIEYLEWIGQEFGLDSVATTPAHSARTTTLYRAFAAMDAYELPLMTRLISGLGDLGFTVHGLTDPTTFAHRVPTVSVSRPGLNNEATALALSDRGIYTWDGHVYALDIIERLGLANSGGILRLGLTHYNSASDVERTLTALAELVSL